MGLTVTPEGPIVIDEELAAIMALTGYVSSINGKQGALSIATIPPLGTPDGYVPESLAGGVVWVSPSAMGVIDGGAL